MPQVKKSTKKVVTAGATAEAEEIHPSKMKKGFDFDGGDHFGGEKIEDNDMMASDRDEAGDLDEEAELDADEINPFGDKWEE